MHRVNSESFRRYAEPPPDDAPRGPVASVNAHRRTGAAVGVNGALVAASGATAVALVSNPVGWGLGLAVVIVGGINILAGAIMAGTAPRPIRPPVQVAVAEIIRWLEIKRLVTNDRMARAVTFEELENEYRIRAVPLFQWMERDTLVRIVRALNACRSQMRQHYSANPSVRNALRQALRRGQG